MTNALALTFKRGGKALPIAGLFLFVTGVVFAARCAHLATLFGFQNISGVLVLLVSGLLMMILFNTVRIDPEKKVVTISSGLRFRPKHKIHQWDEFDSLLASQSWSSGGGTSLNLYLQDKETQERSVLVQQYNDLEEMHDVALKLSGIMGIPAVQSYRGEESPLEGLSEGPKI